LAVAVAVAVEVAVVKVMRHGAKDASVVGSEKAAVPLVSYYHLHLGCFLPLLFCVDRAFQTASALLLLLLFQALIFVVFPAVSWAATKLRWHQRP
jgi:hypothetical protein